jgi:hypothetical protein
MQEGRIPTVSLRAGDCAEIPGASVDGVKVEAKLLITRQYEIMTV